VNERVRAVLFGIALGVAPLLLLDLAGILSDAVLADGDTSPWWPIACYLGAGAVAAIGVGAGRNDRIVPSVAALVLIVVVVPTVPTGLADRLPSLPLLPDAVAAQAVAFTIAGAYVLAAVRGTRG
jgi:hypothetical protein